MAVNMELAKALELSEETIKKIDTLHDYLEEFINEVTLDHDYEGCIGVVRNVEFQLQELWGFTRDSRYHTWVVKLHNHVRELQYLGAVYRCKETSEARTIGSEELFGSVLVSVGNGFIDFGGVVRLVGNLERVA
jgi:hypothetical protein